MSQFVDFIEKDGEYYDIHDKRLNVLTIENSHITATICNEILDNDYQILEIIGIGESDSKDIFRLTAYSKRIDKEEKYYSSLKNERFYGLKFYRTLLEVSYQTYFYLIPDGENLVYKNKNNSFTGNNTFTYSPQTNEVITDASADTKLTTKKYVRDMMDAHLGDYAVLNGKVTAIESKIPSEASSSNKLADKDFVNSTINSLAAFYITKNAQGDPFSTYAELASATVFYSGGEVRVPTRNDYCLVNEDENHEDAACRYIYQGTQWEFQFVVNDTAFTSDQLAAINSGITQALVSQITTNALAITSINSKLPKIKDFVIATTDWQLDNVSGRYYALLDAGNDFVIDDNKVHLYTGTSANDNNLIGTYGINASSDATTQKFRLECYRTGDLGAPDVTINFTITQFGGNQ